MRLTLFGATGGTGRQFLTQALEAGHQVQALVRRPEALADVRHERLEPMAGDLLEAGAVDRAVAGSEAVVFTAGYSGSYGLLKAREGTRLYSAGMDNVLAAMERHGVRRLVAVSSLAVVDAHDEPWFFRVVIKGYFLRKVYDDMILMEQRLAKSPLDWTVLRPPELTDKPRTDRYRLSDTGDLPKSRYLSRADLATALLKELQGGTQHLRRFVAVAD